MSTITAGNTISTSITITGDTTGNLTLSANAAGRVILTNPLQFADGTTANTAASGGGGLTWQSVITSNSTVSSGNAYPVSTVSQPVVITLPASPGAGNAVQLVDYARTWSSNAVTLNRNGANIQGNTSNVTLATAGQAVAIVYVDTAQGWLCYSQGASIGPYSVDALFVAGGGGAHNFAGGGAGGMIVQPNISVMPGTAYTITVGAGGANNTNGSNTAGIGYTAAGGGGQTSNASKTGGSGGSGGGVGFSAANGGVAGSGTAGQGNSGGLGGDGVSVYTSGGGGGGANQAGSSTATNAGAKGGDGISNSYSGTAVTYAGGGGGGTNTGSSAGAGGAGGGGAGGVIAPGSNGTANTGGGGGGGTTNGSGGSGIVIIRYTGAQKGSGGTVTSSGGYTIHTFTSSGTYTA